MEKALILDDDPSKAKLISLWLERYDIKSDMVYNYEEALAKAENKYNYLILDYFLTGKKTGADFANYYQSKHFNCTVYLYSAFPDQVIDVRPVVDFSILRSYLTERLQIPFEMTDYDIFRVSKNSKKKNDRT
jgi:DNA-binding NtrC family response regulator